MVGWIHCVEGRDELAAISIAQRDQLASRTLVCPACAKNCGPTFEVVVLNEDVRLTRWSEDHWENGFLLRK